MNQQVIALALPFLLLLAIGVGILFYRYPVVPYTLAIASPYFKVDPRLAVLNVVNTTLLFVIITLAILVVRLFLVDHLRIPRTPLLPILAYAGIAILMLQSLRYTLSPDYGTLKTVQFVLGGSFFVLAPLLIIRRVKDFDYLVYGLLILAMALALSVLSRLNEVASARTDTIALELGPIAIARVTGAMSVVATVYLATRNGVSFLARLVWLGIAGVLALSMMLTATRATLLFGILAIGLACFLALRIRWPLITLRNSALIRMVIVTVVLFGLFVVVNPGGVLNTSLERFQRLFSGADTSAALRLEFYDAAVQAWKEHPVTGLGIGGYSMYVRGVDEQVYPHNIILELGSELGTPAVLLFLILLVSRQLYMIKALHNCKEPSIVHMLIAAEAFFWFGLANAMVSADLTSNRMLLVATGVSLAASGIAVRHARAERESARYAKQRLAPSTEALATSGVQGV